MTTLRISLPESLRAFVDEQLTKGGYSTASEFIGALLRHSQEREAEQERLEKLLLDGINSGPPIEVTATYWEDKRARLVAEHQETKRE